MFVRFCSSGCAGGMLCSACFNNADGSAVEVVKGSADEPANRVLDAPPPDRDEEVRVEEVPEKVPDKQPPLAPPATKEPASNPVQVEQVAVDIEPIKESPQREEVDEEPPAPKGCCGRCRARFEQQQPSSNNLPFWWYEWMPQAGCAVCAATLLALIGAVTIMASGKCIEITVKYDYNDRRMKIPVDEKMEGPVLMWYDLSNVMLNQKRYVENKDNDLIKPFMAGENVCDQAKSQTDAWNRRIRMEEEIRTKTNEATPDKWASLVRNQTGFRPCGLNSIAMFSDDYELYDSKGRRVFLDQTDIALTKDQDIFEKKMKIINSQSSGARIQIQGEDTWLESGNFFEHFKVWMRSPASPRVRHLWATIPAGLEKGQYVLKIIENSAIWTEKWGVPEKKIVLSTANSLGSKGASLVLGVLTLIAAVAEALMAVFFMISGIVKKTPANDNQQV